MITWLHCFGPKIILDIIPEGCLLWETFSLHRNLEKRVDEEKRDR